MVITSIPMPQSLWLYALSPNFTQHVKNTWYIKNKEHLAMISEAGSWKLKEQSRALTVPYNVISMFLAFTQDFMHGWYEQEGTRCHNQDNLNEFTAPVP